MTPLEGCKIDSFEICLTGDGSPTFQDKAGANQETMHHRGGAYSETQEIYGDLVRFCLAKEVKSFVSVGLGLGYNEILVACEACAQNLPAKEVRLKSYEIHPILRKSFLDYSLSKAPEGKDEELLYKVYDQIIGFFLSDPKYLSLSKVLVLSFLAELYASKRWVLEAALEEKSIGSEKYGGILFDAFSSKTSPELWTEAFLTQFFSQISAETSALATYACTGNLKRALRASGFTVSVRPGFQNKRSSTFAAKAI